MSEVREQLKDLTKDEFLKEYTRDQLNDIAGEFEVEEPEGFGTKGELFDAIVKAADLPDPSLRGESEIDNPVAHVWEKADQMFTEAREAGEPDPRRKDVVEACKADGVTHYTARTQYQAWYTHTNKGQNLISAGNTDGLPRSVAGTFGVEQEEDEEVTAEA